MNPSLPSSPPWDRFNQLLQEQGFPFNVMPESGLPCLHPADAAQVAQGLHLCQTADLTVAGFSADARAVDNAVMLDLTRLNAVREYLTDDLVITVETGLTFGEFQTTLAGQGHDLSVRFPAAWRLADIVMLDPLGLETGLKRGVKEVVLGLEVATPDGQLTKCGGKVVKNVTGYDLNKFYVGTQFALVVPTAVTLRLIARPAVSRWWRVAMASLGQAHDLSQHLLAAPSVTLSALEWMPLASALTLWPDDPWLNALNRQHGPTVWVGWVRSEGLESLVELFEPQLTSALQVYPALAWQPCDAPALETLLPDWHTGLWLEAFLPYGVWPKVADWPGFAVEADRVQARPAASAVSWQWELDTLAHQTLERWQAELILLNQHVHELGGHLRLMQAPGGWEALFARLNLPSDPVVRGLNDQFKARWDPAGTLVSRRLPL